MSRPTTAILLAAALALSLVTLVAALRLPGDNQGYEPVQPIAYSHRLHAGELQIQCQYCHSAADKSRHAGIPSMNVCMNCHSGVTAPLAMVKAEEAAAAAAKRAPETVRSPELQKLYDAMALDEEMLPIAGKAQTPIAWKRIHKLPDFVYFDHRAHITATVACQTCHGPIQEMERVKQFETLSMGWCVNCHREVNETGVNGKQVHASIDCVTCHY
jgi:cytochrome c7-like protein